MDAVSSSTVDVLRAQILERRARLEAAATPVSAGYLSDLLAEIDATLGRMGAGSYGLCEACHEPIEADRLQANPMIRFCLDHLSERELRAHEEDLQLATQIQSRLLPPTDFALEHWDTHYRYEPVGPVGGDYCEIAALEDGRSLFFAVGDVSGKGVAASLLMAHLSAILRSLLTLPLPLAELMSRANRLFCESTLPSQYATLVCGRATATGVELSNAGHCPPLLSQRDAIQQFDTTGFPLGLFCGVEYPVTHLNLAEGESLVLYSDGVTETQDPEDNDFGVDGLTHSLRGHIGGDSRALAQGVVEDVTRFRGGRRATDDLTVLVVRRKLAAPVSRPLQ